MNERTITTSIYTTEVLPASEWPIMMKLSKQIRTRWPEDKLTDVIRGQWTKEQGYRSFNGEVLDGLVVEWYYFKESLFHAV